MNNQSLVASDIHLIKNDNKVDIYDFTMYFQGQYCLSTNRFVGAESLARLKGLNKNSFPFVKYKEIENSDKHYEFCMYTIYKTLNKAQKIIEHIPDFKISINVSVNHILLENFLTDIVYISDCIDIPHENICLEIIESEELCLTGSSIERLKKIQNQGFKIAVDDFGTGFSSLYLISSFDFDYIKIDKSFVKDILTNKKSKEFLFKLIHICQSVGSKVIIEGIEHPIQLSILKDLKDSIIIQGYLCAKPMPVNNFKKLMNISLT